MLCGHMCTHAQVGRAQQARTHTSQADLQGQLHYPGCPLRPYVTGRDLPARELATMHLYSRRSPHAPVWLFIIFTRTSTGAVTAVR